MKKNKTIGEVLTENIKPLESIFPTEIRGAYIEAWERAEKEHAPGIAVRMNPVTFRVEYYNKETGEIVSSHY